jgi:hypothetical protein
MHSTPSQHHRAALAVALSPLLYSLPAAADPAFMQRWVEDFANSEIVLQRGSTNVPFQPLAFVDATHYGESTLERSDGSSVSARQTTLSQGAVLPFLMSPRDALYLPYLGASYALDERWTLSAVMP